MEIGLDDKKEIDNEIIQIFAALKTAVVREEKDNIFQAIEELKKAIVKLNAIAFPEG